MNMYFTDCESCTPGLDNTPICTACLNGFVYEDKYGANQCVSKCPYEAERYEATGSGGFYPKIVF